MTAAARQICPHCHGLGEVPLDSAVVEAEITARVAGMRAACKALCARVTPDGYVRARTAAVLLDKSESRLASMRSGRMGPPFVKRGQVYYSLHGLARWQAEHEGS